MIGTDAIRIHIGTHQHADVNKEGSLIAGSYSREFRFKDFSSGSFAVDQVGNVQFVDGSNIFSESWELA